METMPIDDLFMTAFLVMKGHKMKVTGVSYRAIFLFETTPQLQTDLRMYDEGAQVNLKSFTASYRFVRNEMMKAREYKHQGAKYGTRSSNQPNI